MEIKHDGYESVVWKTMTQSLDREIIFPVRARINHF